MYTCTCMATDPGPAQWSYLFCGCFLRLFLYGDTWAVCKLIGFNLRPPAVCWLFVWTCIASCVCFSARLSTVASSVRVCTHNSKLTTQTSFHQLPSYPHLTCLEEVWNSRTRMLQLLKENSTEVDIFFV